MVKYLNRTLKCKLLLTKRKEHEIRRMLNPLQEMLDYQLRDINKTFHKTGHISSYSDYHNGDLDTPLSTPYVKALYTQAKGSYDSYLAIIESKYKKLVFKSSLDNFMKATLFRLNKNHMWFMKNPIFYWKEKTADKNTWTPCTKATKGAKEEQVSDEILSLNHHIFKKITKWVSLPDLSRVKTFGLNINEARIKPAKNGKRNFYLVLSTLVKRHPLEIPIKDNSYLMKSLQKGKMLNFVQLGIHDKVTVAPVVREVVAKPKEKGKHIGLDWGMVSLFTTSDGRMFGKSFLKKLHSWDKTLTAYSAELQCNGISLKDDKKYQKMQNKIQSYAKNEIGRVLNKISNEDVQKLSVEKLNFAGGGLSRSLNRFLTRCGRKAVSAKLSRLTETKGIVIDEVNPAYTSQTCQRCGYVDRKNRPTQSKFKCKKCGFELNADINASQNILHRTSVMNDLKKKGYKDLWKKENLKKALLSESKKKFEKREEKALQS
ncbi:transposase [Lactobacillus amylolyticus]|uniref:transposase n=1 Tax=Lactobacillus amylolyticus TaxID=83683 RepID=UPI002492D6A0|nr:transposase [Lactobacillus amylolyticus]